MENNLPVIIARLRSERKITQKKAAADLGISQSLLSHYENGIRECSLDFLCRAADYYGVTTDYLLGRTASRDRCGSACGTDAYENFEKEKCLYINAAKIRTPTRKEIFDALDMIFDIVKAAGCENLEAEAALYFSLGIYKLYRAIYDKDDVDPENMFTLPGFVARGESAAMLILLEQRITAHIHGENIDGTNGVESPELLKTDGKNIKERYPQAAKSLKKILNSIENCMPPRY